MGCPWTRPGPGGRPDIPGLQSYPGSCLGTNEFHRVSDCSPGWGGERTLETLEDSGASSQWGFGSGCPAGI